MFRSPKPGYVFLLLIVVGCTPVLVHQLDRQYGSADATRYETPMLPAPGQPEYWQDIRPVMEKRCVVCHGCYDAPCQQNLTSFQGIARGANPELVYALRLRATEPTRLFVDAQTPIEWREKKFHPVLNERENTPEANRAGSVMYRLLKLKQENPLPENQVLDEKVFTFSLDRKQSCPAIETMEAFEKEHPQWGMPYGLPALSSRESLLIEDWLAAGSPARPAPALPAALHRQVLDWETFLNGHSPKERLMSRYVYEHLFLGHLYFDEYQVTGHERPVFFRLVRSSTPPGKPVREIATRRPYDHPGVSPFWYRLRVDEGSVVEKTHMPYALNKAREQRWRQWFLQADYRVEELPSYDPQTAGNPFVVFQAIPVDSRYRFLLDEARFAIDNFIKGPVCRGQVALGVIDDHFWVFFQDPETVNQQTVSEFLASQSDNLRLPNENDGNVRVLQWFKYRSLQEKYLEAKMTYTEQRLGETQHMIPALIWDGDGGDNAALTVFRHSDSATVVKGLVGQRPKTAWVMGYTLMERIHYLLVAGFDVYGGLGHQMNTRLYMDFMRMEGEANFINFLPMDSRLAVRDYWYRDASDDVKEFVYGKHFEVPIETGVVFRSKDYQGELYKLFAQRVGVPVDYVKTQSRQMTEPVRKAFERLSRVRGEGLSYLPQNSILRVDHPDGRQEFFTLVNNSGYSNNSELFGDAKRRLPAEDYLTAVPGLLGAYPNAYYRVDVKNLNAFARQVAGIANAADYTALVDRYGVRRSSPDFWAFSDGLHEYYRATQPVEAGMLDYNRLENR